MYPFLSRFKVEYHEIEDMTFEKILDWVENPKENASYSISELEVHDKLWSVMNIGRQQDGAPEEYSFVDWCRKLALHRNNAATEHADPFRITVKDIAANHLTPAQRKKPWYQLGENDSIPTPLRSLVNVILRKNLGDARVAMYIFEYGIPTLLDADLLRHPIQGTNMASLLEELMKWHASLLRMVWI